MREIPTRKRSLLRQAIEHQEPDDQPLSVGHLVSIVIAMGLLAAAAAQVAGWWST